MLSYFAKATQDARFDLSNRQKANNHLAVAACLGLLCARPSIALGGFPANGTEAQSDFEIPKRGS